LVNYSHQRLSQIERGAIPSMSFAEAADALLDAKGELIALAKAELSSSSGWPRPAQLPLGRALLVGREAELGRILRVTTRPGREPGVPAMVVIEGPPGVGKTSVAIAAATTLAASHPEGTLFRDLAGVSSGGPVVSASVVLEEFLRALGVQSEVIPAGAAERAALFRSLVHGKRMVIVLDNAGSDAQLAELMPNAPGCTVIVTSRRRVTTASRRTAGEVVVLGPLSEDDAVRLVGKIVGEGRVAAEPDAAVRLVRLCGLSPLPVCMAADRIVHRPHHSLADLTADLGEFGLLDAFSGEGDSTPMRSVFSWSYQALSPEQQRAFRLLSVHPGEEFSTVSAAPVLGMSPRGARPVLEGLAQAHLVVEIGRDRWQFHNLLRAYAQDRSAAEDSGAERAGAVSRLVSWYVHSVVAAEHMIAPRRASHVVTLPLPEGVEPQVFNDREAALEWCDLERWNFEPICVLAREHGLETWCWQLVVALWGWLLLRWPTEVWTGTHQVALEAAQEAGEAGGEAWVRANLAYVQRERREYDAAEANLRRSLLLREHLGDDHGQAWALTGLGYLNLHREQVAAALPYFLRALKLFDHGEHRDPPRGRAVALAGLGEVFADQGDAARARRRWDEADNQFATLEDDYGRALAAVRRGAFESKAGHHETAVVLLERSLMWRVEVGDRVGEADSLDQLGRAHYRANRMAAAHTAWTRAHSLFEALDVPRRHEVSVRLSALDLVDLD
jgi:tetratricopeptide (TPR) repeat protein